MTTIRGRSLEKVFDVGSKCDSASSQHVHICKDEVKVVKIWVLKILGNIINLLFEAFAVSY